jgi:hypothetical protein
MAFVAKSVLLNACLLVISAALPLLVLEYYLKWDDSRPDAGPYYTERTLNGTTYRFLEASHAIDNPGRAVLIVGDSFTLGSACADGRNFPSAFTRAARSAGADIHAVNMGVAGSGPVASVRRVQDYFLEKGPTAGVILSLYANDVELDCFACDYFEPWAHRAGLEPEDLRHVKELCAHCHSRDQGPSGEVAGSVGVVRRLNWWLDRWRSYYVLREGLAKVAHWAGWLPTDWGRGSYPARWTDTDGIYFKHIKGSIALAQEEARARGVPLMVVIYPDSMNISPANPFYAIYERAARSLTEATGVPVLSGYHAFVGDPRAARDMPFSLTDTHPNCQAHEIFGEWVLRQWLNRAPPL